MEATKAEAEKEGKKLDDLITFLNPVASHEGGSVQTVSNYVTCASDLGMVDKADLVVFYDGEEMSEGGLLEFGYAVGSAKPVWVWTRRHFLHPLKAGMARYIFSNVEALAKALVTLATKKSELLAAYEKVYGQ